MQTSCGRSVSWFVGCCALLAMPALRAAPVPAGDLAEQRVVRIIIGNKDTEPKPWQGTVSIDPGKIVAISGYNFEQQDRAELDGTFKFQTRRRRPTNSAQRAKGRANMPMQPNGMEVTFANLQPGSQITVETGEGSITQPVSELGPGRKWTMNGQCIFETAAPVAELVATKDTFEDNPAAADGPDGSVNLAYVSFTPGEDWKDIRQVQEAPADFKQWAEPVGGDQLWFRKRSGTTWGEPIAITAEGLDLYRPAVAVAGDGTAWVFWSEQVDCDNRYMGGDWELMARAVTPGGLSHQLRLTGERFADVFASACTDASGKVWVTWMAFRGDNARIMACRQEGDGFTEPEVVADSPRNEWSPSIAAAPDGRVAIVWDSYATGGYDVLARIWQDGKWQEPQLIAGAPVGEMNASAAFDAAGRLWIGYEESDGLWGKDFGPYDEGGQKLYGGRHAVVRVLAGGQVLAPKQPVTDVMPGRPGPQQQNNPRGGSVALPRLATDARGRVWVVCRAAEGNRRVGVGAVWTSWATTYQGDQWTPALGLSGSDAVLDVRPSLLPTTDGGVLAVVNGDHRWGMTNQNPANEDVAWTYLAPPADAPEAQLDPAPANAAPAATTEDADVARMRAYRTQLNGTDLQVLRGEFHRHTEISQDGGGDGTLIDMWRYALDAASLDWIGNGDHDNGGGRENTWWRTQKTTTIFDLPPAFCPMFTYERSVSYPDGHRNVVFAKRGVRTLARLRDGLGKAMDDLPPEAKRPNSPDTQMLYRYLKQLDGICASHTSGTDMGTDWRDNDPEVEPFVEIYQGDRQNYERPDAPRSPTADNAIGGYRPYGFVSLALERGIKFAFESSSDHISTHMSYANMLVTDVSRDAILAAFKARRGYGATDNILADLRCTVNGQDHLMGEEFASPGPPRLKILIHGTQPIAKVIVIRNNEVVWTHEPDAGTSEVKVEWADNQPVTGKTSYYYVRGEQTDGELVWLSPMWIKVGA